MNANERLWNKNLALIEKFHRENGRWPRILEIYRGINLGEWLKRQRRLFLIGALDRTKQKMLGEVGYDVKKPNFFDTKWGMYFECLKKYRVKHRNKWPSQTERFPENVSLGRWCYAQKFKYNEGLLTNERIRQLESIHFPFKKIVPREVNFEKQLEYLKRYRKKYPNSWPKTNTEFPGGNKLGIWCNNMKRLRRDMPVERVEKLNAIGFDWDPLQTRWDRNYEFVEKFVKKNKRLPSTRMGSSEREIKATAWIHTQRTKLKQGKMPREERLLLKKLGIK